MPVPVAIAPAQEMRLQLTLTAMDRIQSFTAIAKSRAAASFDESWKRGEIENAIPHARRQAYGCNDDTQWQNPLSP